MLDNFRYGVFPMALQPKSGLGLLLLRFFTHTQLDAVGLLWTSDQHVAEAYNTT
jgi:hypothetical protein